MESGKSGTGGIDSVMDIEIKLDLSKLRAIKDKGGKEAVRRALGTLAYLLEAEAKKQLEGSRSGRIYGEHQASAPGEAPATLTGNLKNTIVAEPEGDGTKRWVVAVGAEQGAGLEFGTQKIAPRPFMRPAAGIVQDAMGKIFEDEFNSL